MEFQAVHQPVSNNFIYNIGALFHLVAILSVASEAAKIEKGR